MKTILSFLLLPILVFAQPYGQHLNEFFDIELSINAAAEFAHAEEIEFPEVTDATIEIFVRVEVYVWEIEIDNAIPMTYNGATFKTPPKYLNTFSLEGWAPVSNDEQRSQERLDQLLALNDPMFPKEDTLFDRFQPIRYQRLKLGGVENMPEGFGPRISL